MTIVDRLLAITGIIPPFLLLWYAENFERRVQEPTRSYRYRVLVCTGLATVPIAWIEHAVAKLLVQAPEPQATLFESFVLAATVEETAKFTCLYLLTRRFLAPKTRYGAFLYALHAAMGFALVENVIAMLKAPDMFAFSTRYFLRAYMTVPMHLLAGGVTGYVWARRRFDRGAIGLAGGTAIAIAIHGTFNSCLLAVERLPDAFELLRITCAALAMLIPLGGVLVLRLLAGALRSADATRAAAEPEPERGRRVRSTPPPALT
jgi:RsiW-degrading membrane proteinase PrsW (M82 family)